MPTPQIRLAPGLAALEALGVSGPEELFEASGARLEQGQPGAVPGLPGRSSQPEPDGRSVLRFPLPGTPDAAGRLTGRPSDVGTGWVVLSRWRNPPLRALLRSRLTAPRSTSLAEREWNLYCRLLDHGVGVPRPLAVGSRGQGLFARESFLVTRELRGFEPLELWVRGDRDPGRRRRAASALGLLLANVVRAGVMLPELRIRDLAIQPEPTGEFGASCDDHGPSVPGRLRMRRLPGVGLVGVRGGSLRKELRSSEVAAMLRSLAVDGRELGVAPHEMRRVLVFALGGLRAADGRERRRIFEALA